MSNAPPSSDGASSTPDVAAIDNTGSDQTGELSSTPTPREAQETVVVKGQTEVVVGEDLDAAPVESSSDPDAHGADATDTTTANADPPPTTSTVEETETSSPTPTSNNPCEVEIHIRTDSTASIDSMASRTSGPDRSNLGSGRRRGVLIDGVSIDNVEEEDERGDLPPVRQARPSDPTLSGQAVLPSIGGASGQESIEEEATEIAFVEGGSMEVARYFRQYGVVKLFKEMATTMLLNKSSDPYDIMLERLSRKEPWDHL
eukprot:m.27767 g.27767  ORF g.27767 m.27767 type:complete len:259 (+) comp6473_c0_seq1:2717-3493(+)